MEQASPDLSIYIVIGGIVMIFFLTIAYGMYTSFGKGKEGLVDKIDEHARMHELGIAHSHGDRK